MVSATSQSTRDFLTPPEIGERYGVGEGTVINWIRRGVKIAGQRIRLDALRIGSRYRVSLTALDEFLRQCSPSATAVDDERRQQNAVAAQAASVRIKKRVGLK